uniref:Uncharacterized protein n=1 Tax=Anguilla anguilla TaxID=7936 RepID=A0A0E9TKM0_ANGAN
MSPLAGSRPHNLSPTLSRVPTTFTNLDLLCSTCSQT